jgi:ribose transport system permease protein
MTATAEHPQPGRTRVPAALRARGRFAAIVPIFAFLILISAIFAPSSVSSNQLQSLMFFAAILGFAALGQHLIITVGGLDLSVGPVITLSALLFAAEATSGGSAPVAQGVAAALIAGAVVGALNGLTVTVLRVTPLIATLAGGAIATGLAYTFNGQGAPESVPDSVNEFLARTPLGIPLSAYLWMAAVALVALALRCTVAGRRFIAVGSNPTAGRALGIRVDGYKVTAYVVGGMLYGAAGILLSVAVTTPGLGVGNTYLLPSIAAVVIGGTALGGGLGSVLATGIGTLFVVQLNNFTLALNGDVAIQQIVQGAVIIAAMAIYSARLDLRKVRWSGRTAEPQPT